MIKKNLAVIFILLLSFSFLFAEEPVDLQMIQKIKVEGFENSKVMDYVFYITDVYGPRLTSSPNHKKAGEWIIKTLTDLGLENAKMEAWGTFGRSWSFEKVSLELLEPTYSPLIAYPKAWTAGTDSVLFGTPVIIDTEEADELDEYAGKLKNAIVMTGKPRDFEFKFEAEAERETDETLAEISQAPEPGAESPWADYRARYRKLRAFRRALNDFLKEEGAALTIEPSQREHGTVRVHRGGERTIGSEPAVPALVLSNEQYGRIYRILKKDIPVTLQAEVKTSFYDDDSLAYNVIAEIPGTDRNLKNEVVMLGGHLDSWHAGTGATDNGANCAVAMEVVRILKALNVKPRRTIRIGLWSGEEQGILGSNAYVKNHFADKTTMELKPEHKNISVYFNLDNGAGKIRGIYLQENDAVRPIFEAWLKPFHDMGATTVSIRNTGGTDHLAFNAVGIPGFQFIQDPLDYMPRTHHTNMDVYEHCPESDLMQNSVIMAAFVYHAAMRDSKIPRKQLPKPQPESRRY